MNRATRRLLPLFGLLALAGCILQPPPPDLNRMTISYLYPRLKPNDLVTCSPDNGTIETMSKCIDIGAAQEDAQKAEIAANPQYQAELKATDECIQRLIAAGYVQTASGEMFMMCSGNGYVSPMLWRDQEDDDSGD